jgi:histidinol dehydrogenase
MNTLVSIELSIGTPATLPTTGFAKSINGVAARTYLTTIATAALSPQRD